MVLEDLCRVHIGNKMRWFLITHNYFLLTIKNNETRVILVLLKYECKNYHIFTKKGSNMPFLEFFLPISVQPEWFSENGLKYALHLSQDRHLPAGDLKLKTL